METTETTATETGTGTAAQANTGALLGTASQPAVSSEQAKNEIATLRGDKTFVAKLMSKDGEANARWTRLHEAAFPDESPAADTTSPTAGQPKAQPNTALPNADGQDDAAVFAPPDSPAGYRFDRLPNGVQHDLEQETFVREAFHAAGVPQGIAGQIHRMFSQAISNPPDATALELSRQQAHIQLEKTFGADKQRVIETAQKEFYAMAARPGGHRLVELAERSGLGNSFYAITSLYNMARAKGRA